MKIISEEVLGAEATAVLEAANIECIVDANLTRWQEGDALILSGNAPVPEALYETNRPPKVIAHLNKDSQYVDAKKATRAGIMLLEPRHGEAASIADYAMSMVLKMARERQEGAFELKGKSIGFLGFTPTAAEIAQRARGFDMNLYCYDADLNRGRAMLYNCEATTLVDLFVMSDFVIVLAPLSSHTKALIGKDEIQLLKKGASLIHLTDPQVLRWDELVMCLDWEYLSHFAIDLPSNKAHLKGEIERYATVTVNEAANTLEARRGNEVEMVRHTVAVLEGEMVETAVNVAHLRASHAKEGADWCRLANFLGQCMGQRLKKLPGNCTIEAKGFLPGSEREAIIAHALTGVAIGMGEGAINPINAALWAEEHGMHIRFEEDIEQAHGHLKISMITELGRFQFAGDIINGVASIFQVDDYLLRARPTAHVLLVPHINRPGMVGQVGTLLGEEEVNISGMVLGHKHHDLSTALMWITIEQAPDAELAAQSKRLSSVLSMEYIHLQMDI